MGDMVEDPQIHKQFILVNWEPAAAIAWQEYQRQGRGAIMVVSEWGKVRDPWRVGETPGAYVSEKNVKEWSVAWPNEDVERMVKAYDPRREVVFVFLRLDGGVSSYRISIPYLLPPEAYEQMKGQLRDWTLTRDEFKRMAGLSDEGNKRV